MNKKFVLFVLVMTPIVIVNVVCAAPIWVCILDGALGGVFSQLLAECI